MTRNATRNLLLTLLLLITSAAWGQSAFQNEGDEAFEAGLYKQALDLYKQAEPLDHSPLLTFKKGEACRLSNGYAEAITYYKTLAESAAIAEFPQSLFYLGMMHKCNGSPDSALFYFKRYLVVNPKDSLREARTQQEIAACQWIMDSTRHPSKAFRYVVRHETKNVNTANSESGAIKIADSLMLFSSIQEMSRPGTRNSINSDLVLMQIYESSFDRYGNATPFELNRWGLNSKSMHTGNVAYDDRNQTLYFNRCPEDNTFSDIPCDIYFSKYSNGKWSKPKPLGGDINLDGYSSTQPSVGYLPDGNVILYFSSNRPGGMGGMDIWYSIIKPDCSCTSPCVNLGAPVNSPGNEITPFYDNNTQTLFFSSDWHYGYGGYDVFSSQGQRDGWKKPENLGRSLNSPANDIFFSVNRGSKHASSEGYLTSNRSGSFYQHGNTCCNDIYRWSIEKIDTTTFRVPERPKIATPPPPVASNKQRATKLLPIALYFHNDEPDPSCNANTTTLTYYQTYNRYMFMRREYKEAQRQLATGARLDSLQGEIDQFFSHDIYDNCQKFEQFMRTLRDDLAAGRSVQITVAGYASPLHSGDYNFNLSKRRISSIINQLMAFDNGSIARHMGTNGRGMLKINEVAYGSSKAAKHVSNDRHNQALSVYSIDAAKERRIEIVDYAYEGDEAGNSCLVPPGWIIHMGTYFSGEVSEMEVHLPHSSATEKQLDFISLGFPNAKVLGYSSLVPNEDLVLYLSIDNRDAAPASRVILPVTLRVRGENITQTIFLEYSLMK